MSEPTEPTALEIAQAAAARLSQTEWQLDAEPSLDAETSDVAEPPEPPPPPPPPVVEPPPPRRGSRLFPNTVSDSVDPPTPDQIVEAMLFTGGPPLTAAKACSAIRGLTTEGFRESVDRLAAKYRRQHRPYAVRPKEDGFVLLIRSEYRGMHERLFGGPREARLSASALDVLSLVAYRQPVAKSEVDALRGAESGSVLRQLVRLGLIAVSRPSDAPRSEMGYHTTPRFLDLFGIHSLEELPRLADAAP